MKTAVELLAEIKRNAAVLRDMVTEQPAAIGGVAIPDTARVADAPKPIRPAPLSGKVKPKPEAALPVSWQRRI
jgi:hypothetical protein